MADEASVIARARDYMRDLSEGRDPLTGRTVSGNPVLEQPRLQRCFSFVADLLQRELIRMSDQTETYLPTQEQAAALCSDEDIPASEFYRRMSDAAAALGKTPVPGRVINHFLLRSGLADGRIESIFVERRVLRANARSEQVGIYDKLCISPRTGALRYTLMFSPDTQRWLLDLLPELAAGEEKATGEDNE